jgi:hypothetical protein
LGPLTLRSWKDGEQEIVILDAVEIVERAASLARESYRRLPFALSEREEIAGRGNGAAEGGTA